MVKDLTGFRNLMKQAQVLTCREEPAALPFVFQSCVEDSDSGFEVRHYGLDLGSARLFKFKTLPVSSLSIIHSGKVEVRFNPEGSCETWL